MTSKPWVDFADAEAGLAAALVTLEKKWTGKLVASGSKVSAPDASTLLGLDFQAKQYESRRLALIDPAQYAAKRATAFDDMKTAVNGKYTNAVREYTASGLPPEVAKKFALQAAANESSLQQQTFELQYPSGANALELTTQAHKFQGLGGAAPQARRAPARRRARR